MSDEDLGNKDVAEAPEPRAEIPHHGESETKAAIFRLLLVVGTGVLASIYTGKFTTILLISGIVLMILIHELGHFVMAKRAGMKVTEFFLGFGPTLWKIKRGETEYGIKGFPLGAYVKIIGMSSLEEVDPAEEHRTYRQKGYLDRMGVAVAGSFMHFVMAFLIWILVSSGLGLYSSNNTIQSLPTVETGPTPAQVAGLQVGDKIVALDGKKMSSFQDQIQPYIKDRTGQQIVFTVERGGQNVDIPVTPTDRRRLGLPNDVLPEGGKPIGFVGFGPERFLEKKSIPAAAVQSAKEIKSQTGAVITKLGELFSPSGVNDYSKIVLGTSEEPEQVQAEKRFMSPVGVGKAADNAATAGLRESLLLLFMINVFVGTFNMIPLLPFDGGHVAIATYEKVRSIKRGERYYSDHTKFMPVTYAVFFVLALIFVTSLYLDITNPLPNLFK